MFNFLQHIFMMIEGYVIWGWNIITGKTRTIAKERMFICNNCHYNKKGICKLCGCILKAKTRVNFIIGDDGISIDGCPDKRW